ncbi:response regulator [Paenibacillus sp. GCM10027626]|uniref:response regulator transcription factor n=1 Tax=Paenibacillus sp. GCM10027626 TaxID=3273411 RepID=UPI003627E770
MKIMVIDDEPIVARGLRTLVPWEEHGFQWLPPADNGVAALRQIEQTRPDLLLLDCKMPLMTGLELLAELKERHIPHKAIILSGHDEFEYARQALQLGALDYVLKPPDIEQLLKTVLRAKEEWQQEQKKARQSWEQRAIARERLVRSLLEGTKMDEAQLAGKLAELQMTLQPAPFYVILMDIIQNPDDPKAYLYEDRRLMNYAVANIAEETLADWNPFCVVLDESVPRFALLLNINGSGGDDRFQQCLKQLIHNIHTTLQFLVTIGISSAGANLLCDGPTALAQAAAALERQYYTGPNELIGYNELLQSGSSSERGHALPGWTGEEERLENALRAGDPALLEDWMADFFAALARQDTSVSATRTAMLQAMLLAANALAELHPALKPQELLTAERVEAVLAAAALSQLQDVARSYFRQLLDRTVTLRHSGKNSIVETVKRYIDARYAEAISLDTLAREVFVSPVYLSFLFKQVKGMNVTDYLTQVRLDRAKELLRGASVKTYEIARLVGYQDEKYFSRLFKKKVGMTPSEFRNQ